MSAGEPRWELKRVWLPTSKFITGLDQAWKEAETLATEGWDLVGISPEEEVVDVAYVNAANPNVSHRHVTSGHLLVFKRILS